MSEPSTSTSTFTPPASTRARDVCRYYSAPGGCWRGGNCKYLHATPDAPDAGRSPFDANKTCILYQRGTCRRGAECWFKHSLPSERPALTESKNGANMMCIYFQLGMPCKRGAECKFKHDTLPSTSAAPVDNTNADEEETVCSICLESPNMFGLLDACNHIFCKECIRGWRDQPGKSLDVLISQTNKTCPTCRTHSRFIIPSRRFPTTQTEKKQIVDNYKKSMRQVPCRYFIALKERPFCPFGRDCFYKHEQPDGSRYEFNAGADIFMPEFKRQKIKEARSQRQVDDLDFAARNFVSALRTIAEDMLPAPSVPMRDGSRGFRIGDGLVAMSDEQVRLLSGLFMSAHNSQSRGENSGGANTSSTNGNATSGNRDHRPDLLAELTSSLNLVQRIINNNDAARSIAAAAVAHSIGLPLSADEPPSAAEDPPSGVLDLD